MDNQRPIYLNLFQFRFPVMAIVSILHRLSGVIVFLLVPVLLWVLKKSLLSQVEFNTLRDGMAGPMVKFLLWVVLSALMFHLVAGIRHLLMDMGYFDSKEQGKITSYVTFAISALIILLLGVSLW